MAGAQPSLDEQRRSSARISSSKSGGKSPPSGTCSPANENNYACYSLLTASVEVGWRMGGPVQLRKHSAGTRDSGRCAAAPFGLGDLQASSPSMSPKQNMSQSS